MRTVATGRTEDLKNILATIRGNLTAATIQHLIVSAPRGYGKSFMMRHIQIEVERIAREENLALVTLLMPEEMPHVREPETLIRELTSRADRRRRRRRGTDLARRRRRRLGRRCRNFGGGDPAKAR